MIVLGLDISTSNVGVCVMNSELPAGSRKVLALGIPISNVEGLYNKAEVVRKTFVDIRDKMNVDAIVIEESLKSFKRGSSTPQVIACLNRFNGIISYISRTTFDKPVFLKSFTEARKQVGIVLPKGLDVKPIIFNWVKEKKDMEDFPWEYKTISKGKRKGIVVEEPICYDISDAFVMSYWGINFLKIDDLDVTIL